MSQPFSKEQKQQWEEKIIAQKNSGVSIAEWCRQNEIANHVFYYWKRKLFPEPTVTLSSFTEVPFEKGSQCLKAGDSGIKIEYQDVRIYLDKHFDSSVLKQCLLILKGATC
jgi:hypothetical protein